MRIEKTVQQWFQELSEEYGKAAFVSMINPYKEVEKMSDAIADGLKKWETTPEGHEYWQALYFNYRKYDYPDKALRIPGHQTMAVHELINMRKILEFNTSEDNYII